MGMLDLGGGSTQITFLPRVEVTCPACLTRCVRYSQGAAATPRRPLREGPLATGRCSTPLSSLTDNFLNRNLPFSEVKSNDDKEALG